MLMSSKIQGIGVRVMKKIQFMDKKNVISDNVRLLRVKNQLTQQDPAAKMQTLGVNMDQQMISRIESNDRIVTDYELACLCHIFKVEPQELWGDFAATYLD